MQPSDYAVHQNTNAYTSQKSRHARLGHLDLELTERCNNACIHCLINLPLHDRAAREKELSTDEWKDILRQAAALGALSVRITGGEPLAREDFADLYLFTRKLGIKVILFTNARLITPELADLFARIPPLEPIEITVYGMHPESYEAVSCVRGSFAEYRQGIDLLLERGVPFIVKGALLPPNRGELEEFTTWAASLPYMSTLPGVSMMYDLRARRDSRTKNERIARLRATPEEAMRMFTRDEQDYRKITAQFCRKFMGTSGADLFSCGAGNGGCVDAYGRLKPCMMLNHPDFSYDLRAGSLEDAIIHFFPSKLDLRAQNPEYLNRCGRCFLKGLCDQCPAKSYIEYGTLDTPVEYTCQIAHAQACYLGLLAEGEKAWEVTDGAERVQRLSAEE